jgi:hypothetical protein
MNKAKTTSTVNGKAFLRDAFIAQQEVLSVQLKLSSTSITHDGLMGDVNEQHFIHFLRKHLPKRYVADSGIVIDSNGNTSDQIDVVIFDNQYTPTLLDQHSHRFIPAEAVYCVLEVKPAINKGYLEYAGAKAHSVRVLERTSWHAGGMHAAKELFPILAGLVAIHAEWTDGLVAEAFSRNLAELKDTYEINCGLALSDRSFDTFDQTLTLSNPTGSLASFLFRLLQQLQALGTVPAVDWNRYAAILSEINS